MSKKKAKKKGRGGARENAGRKSLTDDQRLRRLVIGAYRERLQRKKSQANARAKVDHKTNRAHKYIKSHRDQQLMRLARIPQDEREAWMESDDEFQNYRGGVHRRIAGLPSTQGQARIKGVLVSAPLKQPKGERGESISERLTEQVADKFCVPESVVRECWREFKALVRGVESDTATSEPRADNAHSPTARGRRRKTRRR